MNCGLSLKSMVHSLIVSKACSLTASGIPLGELIIIDNALVFELTSRIAERTSNIRRILNGLAGMKGYLSGEVGDKIFLILYLTRISQ